MFNEALLRSFHQMYGLDYVALRYFNVYGPRMDTYGAYTEVLIRWMERLADGKPCLILGDGSRNDGFRVHRRRGQSERYGSEIDRDRRSFQHRKRDRNELNELATALVAR